MRRLVTPQAILELLMAFPASVAAKKPPVPPRVSYVSGPHRWEPHERGG
jgi:hypothetical protein